MKIACESIDRLVTTEVRLPYLERGIIPALYDAARKDGDPLFTKLQPPSRTASIPPRAGSA